MNPIVKKIAFSLLFTAFTAVAVQAQTTKKAKLRKHACTEACAKGAHVYAHGEKKHKCRASCTPAGMTLKQHACTAACANGKHLYQHGEKDHACDAHCKGM